MGLGVGLLGSPSGSSPTYSGCARELTIFVFSAGSIRLINEQQAQGWHVVRNDPGPGSGGTRLVTLCR